MPHRTSIKIKIKSKTKTVSDHNPQLISATMFLEIIPTNHLNNIIFNYFWIKYIFFVERPNFKKKNLPNHLFVNLFWNFFFFSRRVKLLNPFFRLPVMIGHCFVIFSPSYFSFYRSHQNRFLDFIKNHS